ncbi:acetolactate synthase large subunit [Bowdeniella nasicola]|uniref:Acetolactate synthase n=1 Tax=Bowdeniella nasicola TaxID=208480 RepID=A0A1Q5PZI0_9ACTO|nr:acetolactate synthase large subunit [Bowdeniella nasicola]OKL53033.1 acetolactate synthase large subunit [Bowdeniella nasicola]
MTRSTAADGRPPQGKVPQQSERMTGSQAVIRALEELGVDTVFGLPGGAILPTYDPLFASTKLRHILVRHEQGAGHAAEGYAAATGRVGVCIATSGPGATNLITALANANMDSTPMVAITGQVAANFIGTDAFQEADIVGATMPVTKHSFLITKPEEIPARIAEAFYIARTGRPGPVLVDITKTSQVGELDFSWPPQRSLPGYKPMVKPHHRQIKAAAAELQAARRPVLLVGGGTIRAGASAKVSALADLTNAAVVTTLMGRGGVPDTHPNHLGMPGMHGSVPAVAALQRADLIVALGARFDDRVTGDLETFAPGARVIHADIDPAEISKNRQADVPIVGDIKDVVTDLLPGIKHLHDRDGAPDLTSWWRQLNALRENYPLGWTATDDGLMAPQEVIAKLGELAGPDAIYCSGVGQHQMWAAQFIRYDNPKTWLNSGGLGTMGYAIPAAMGAKVGMPEKEVWAIDGDGCFQMTNQELATCALNDIPIKIALINNSSLGMVRQWQTLFYDGRYSHTDLETGHETRTIPDFVKLADAYGCVGLRCTRPEDIEDTIRQAQAITDRPVVIDFVVSRDAMVWPMVPAGVSNDEIQYARGLTPQWEEE